MKKRMNKRIEELADKSYVTVLTTWGHEMIPDGCYIVSPDKLQQFAELIVEECVDIAHSEGDDVGYLKNYFGVE